MAEYRTIRMSFWNDPYIEELCAEEKLLYLYLFTSPHTNNLGILEITRRKIAFESGLSVEVVDRGIARFEADGKAVTDGNIVWLSNFIKNQTSTSGKLVKGLRELLAETGSEKIREALCKRYPDLFGAADTPSKGMDTVCIPSGEEEEERELKTPSPPKDIFKYKDARVAKTVPDGEGGDGADGKEHSPDENFDFGFAQVWDAYPKERRGPVADAVIAWKGLARARDLPGLPLLLEAVTRWEASDQWQRENGRFVPYFANFLRRRMWEQEPPPEPSPSARNGPGLLARTVRDVEMLERNGRARLLLKERRREKETDYAQAGRHAETADGVVPALPAGEIYQRRACGSGA